MTLTYSVKEHSFLAGLNDLQIDKLAALSQEVTFCENERILSAREQSRFFYLLLEGTVCIEVNSRSYVVCIQALGPGDAFGWSALLDHHDTLFQVRAREQCRALRIDGSDLTAAFRNDPELAVEILRRTLSLVAGRVQATETRLGELCGIRVPSEAARLRAQSCP
ncbi:MAG TPA: cyclic nucleotide-binding domain-containing protein [Bryobacteraceae bacterium]|nr:cyclic nucleotide-binding domain-containing protein [Bryobacteraceae bacterium]